MKQRAHSVPGESTSRLSSLPLTTAALCALGAAGLLGILPSFASPAAAGETLLDRALAGPMKDVRHIVLATRGPYDDGHWYANIGYYCDDERRKAYAGNGAPDSSALLVVDVESGEARPLLDAAGGSVRDPVVHYDARRVLFSYRKASADSYNLHEIGVDGSGLRQVTSGPWDDYEPVYLPDGDILFVSTRCNRWVNCWMTQVGVLYRCDANGRDVRPVSANTEHDNTPWVMPDGRILYTRWEYVDRSQVEYHHLWVMNPDGTGQTVYYGNLRSWTVMIDAKPIPGTDRVVASFSPGHGANEHAGVATVVSPDAGPDEPGSVRAIHKGPFTRDPYPLSDECYLVARGRQVLLMDGAGATQVVYTHAGPSEVHEPRPILKRPRERIIPDRVARARSTGTMLLTDAYDGRRLEGVRRGEVKKLLVLESLPKPVNFSGGPDLVSWLGTFTLERVLGTVPVERDGSAHFEVPAGRQVFFAALDEKDLSVKRMQSFTCAMPGETIGCVGCHESRTRTPRNRFDGMPMAARRPPSRIEPFEGFPDVLDFHRDVQPILDAHCVPCHGYEHREGRTILAGDLGPTFSHAYVTLLARRQVADGQNGLGNRPPRSIGSSASPLLAKVDGSHHGVKVSPRQWRTLWLWIESGAPYAGTYAALRNEAAQARESGAGRGLFSAAGSAIARRCGGCHGSGKAAPSLPVPFDVDARKRDPRRGDAPAGQYERIIFDDDPIARFGLEILLNLSRPSLSPILLGPLARDACGFGSCGDVFRDDSDPDYRTLLLAIERIKAAADAEPRFSTPGFRPNRQYVREMVRFGVLPEAFDPARDPIDPFRTDQEYWRSFWHLPTRTVRTGP